MKTYLTSIIGIVALLMLLTSFSFINPQQAKATCSSFTVYGVQDTGWTFTAAVGKTQVRNFLIENTSDTDFTFDATITGYPVVFSTNWTQTTIKAHDTSTVFVTFSPLANSGSFIDGKLVITLHERDCSWSLGLHGTATGGTGGGGGVVSMSPATYEFGPIAAGADTCHYFYLVNNTGTKVTISSLKFNSGANFSFSPAFNGITIDSASSYRFSVCFKGNANATTISDSLIATYQLGVLTLKAAASLIGHTTAPPPVVVLVADPKEYNFGSVAYGTSACKDIIVTNQTNSWVVIRYWGTCDTNNLDFTVSPVYTNVYDTIPAKASMTFTMCYRPHASNIQGNCGLYINYLELNPVNDGQISVNLFGNSTDSGITHTAVCLTTEQGSNSSDAIIIGTTADHTLHLINSSNHAITVDSVFISGANSNVFSISNTQIPITVPANSTTTTLTYTFAPTSNNNGSNEFTANANFHLTGDSLGCETVKGVLIGKVVHNNITTDSTVRPLFPDDHRTLAIEGTGTNISSTFTFTNNLDNPTRDVSVTAIYLDDSTYFSISSYTPNPTPFTLHPGDNMQVVISLTATDNKVHHATLKIDASHTLQSQDFDLQGLNATAASVSTSLPEGVAINVTPNPASSYVNVMMSGANSADIQVYDLLGAQIASSKTTSNWKWDASNMAAGSYIIRVAGISSNGEQFVASKRVVVTK